MTRIQYWRGDQFIGTDVEVGEDKNPYECCPFCHRKVSTVYWWYNDDFGGDLPQGCFHCVDSYERGEPGYEYELDPDYEEEYDEVGEAIDRAYEDRRDRELMEEVRREMAGK